MFNNQTNAKIFEDKSIDAYLKAQKYAGEYGIVGSIPLIALHITNSKNLNNTILERTFATSTNIHFNFNNTAEIIISHGTIFPPLRKVTEECEIILDEEEYKQYLNLLKETPNFSYNELINKTINELPLKYQLRLNIKNIKDNPEQIAHSIYGHPKIFQQYKQTAIKLFGNKTKLIDESEWQYWIANNKQTSIAVMHFDPKIGTYSDYVGFEEEHNYVLGINNQETKGLLQSSEFKLNM